MIKTIYHYYPCPWMDSHSWTALRRLSAEATVYLSEFPPRSGIIQSSVDLLEFSRKGGAEKKWLPISETVRPSQKLFIRPISRFRSTKKRPDYDIGMTSEVRKCPKWRVCWAVKFWVFFGGFPAILNSGHHVLESSTDKKGCAYRWGPHMVEVKSSCPTSGVPHKLKKNHVFFHLFWNLVNFQVYWR